MTYTGNTGIPEYLGLRPIMITFARSIFYVDETT